MRMRALLLFVELLGPGYRTLGNADPFTASSPPATISTYVCSSIVNLLPSTVLEKPHCGLMPS